MFTSLKAWTGEEQGISFVLFQKDSHFTKCDAQQLADSEEMQEVRSEHGYTIRTSHPETVAQIDAQLFRDNIESQF